MNENCWQNAVYPECPVHMTTREALDKIARLTAEVERLRVENERLPGKSLGLLDRLGSVPFRFSDDIPEGAVWANAAWWEAFSNPPSVEEIEAQVASLKMVPLAPPTNAQPEVKNDQS